MTPILLGTLGFEPGRETKKHKPVKRKARGWTILIHKMFGDWMICQNWNCSKDHQEVHVREVLRGKR